MIRWLRVLTFALAWTMASTSGAADIKVGFVDVSRVLDQSPQAREARERIQAEFAPIDQEILRLQREQRTLEEQLLRDGDVMANAERMRLEREVLSRKRDLRRAQEEFREDLNLRRNQELQKLQRQVVLAIRAMAKSEDFDLVISDGVLFASTRIDITGTVLERLVEEHDRQGGN
ncbi:MAG: OmpH family outer membrane protein [Immundisolibacterales bacterium]|nr:OmpH family outer membrane protein [Immundisolibacterales bacterium]